MIFINTDIHCYNMNFIVTTNQKPTKDTWYKKKKESKQNTKDSHQITEESKEERSKELKNKKAINEMAVSISTYQSRISFKYKQTTCSNSARHRVAELDKNKTHIHMLPTTDSFSRHRDAPAAGCWVPPPCHDWEPRARLLCPVAMQPALPSGQYCPGMGSGEARARSQMPGMVIC